MNLKLFIATAKQIAEEKKICFEEVIEIIKRAMVSAYCKDSGRKGQSIKAEINLETGDVKFWQEKLVVDESICDIQKKDVKKINGSKKNLDEKIIFDPEKHILLEQAVKIKPDIKLQGILKIQLPVYENCSRIAAQIARQVLLQEIRKIEKENIFQKYIKKQGEIMTGIVERISHSTVFVNIESVTAFLLKQEQIPGEFYRVGQRLKFLILRVEKDNKEVSVFLSRVHPDFILKLFFLEIPEIRLGQVEIKGIVREAGFRSKIAVCSSFQNIDPIGTLVGLKGNRIGAIIQEIGKEKIDIMLWTEDQEQLICNALSPAKILSVEISERKALVSVSADQMSLAIGKQGQNVRLASKITGYDINIKEIEQNTNHQKTIDKEIVSDKENTKELKKQQTTNNKQQATSNEQETIA